LNGARVIAAEPGRLRVEGVLDFSSVTALAAEAESLFPASGPLRIDLSGVESANSAGLALLLEWLERAQSRRLKLEYLNLPDSLKRIAAISNLGSLVPVAPPTAS
jgi:phospholipid transport system transporter-binding protein